MKLLSLTLLLILGSCNTTSNQSQVIEDGQNNEGESPQLTALKLQPIVDACIEAWKTSPFKKGDQPNKIIDRGVKVFGLGNGITSDSATEKPSLVLVQATVNVLGKSSLELTNPNGWYCFKSNINVLGKMEIILDCDSHIASAETKKTTVLAANDGKNGVAVLGSTRIRRINCKKE